MHQPIVGYLTGIAIVLGGILVLWYVKIRTRDKIPMDRFGTFFLGGGQVGERLTSNNNWGLCFAFANSIWYYAYLGYYYGIYILFLQMAWSLAIVVIASNLPSYLRASKDGTVHGFISHRYGLKASLLAATATLIGYTLNVGFEVFYSAHLFAVTIGGIRYELLIALSLAVFIGGYSAIGGYMANVISDPIQNIIGVISLVILVLAVGYPLVHSGQFGTLLSASQATAPPISMVIGVCVFSFFFNIVDMANWQSMAANSQFSGDQLKPIRNGYLKSAALQMIAPALFGTFFGAALKVVQPNVADDGYFSAVVQPHLENMSVLSGLVIGLLILGFFSVTISSAGSYLVAALQTLALDVFKRRDAEKLRLGAIEERERHAVEVVVIDWVKRMMMPVSIFMTLVFAGLYYVLTKIDKQGLAFQFQFVMYGAATTLVPAVVSGLRRPHSGPMAAIAGFWSILIGLCFVIVPFIVAEFAWQSVSKFPLFVAVGANSDDIVNLTPLFGLSAAYLTFVILGGGKRHVV